MKLFKYGIIVFNSRQKKYEGFNHFISGKIFKWIMCYLYIYIKQKFKFKIVHNDANHHYDGYYNHISISRMLS